MRVYLFDFVKAENTFVDPDAVIVNQNVARDSLSDQFAFWESRFPAEIFPPRKLLIVRQNSYSYRAGTPSAFDTGVRVVWKTSNHQAAAGVYAQSNLLSIDSRSVPGSRMSSTRLLSAQVTPLVLKAQAVTTIAPRVWDRATLQEAEAVYKLALLFESGLVGSDPALRRVYDATAPSWVGSFAGPISISAQERSMLAAHAYRNLIHPQVLTDTIKGIFFRKSLINKIQSAITTLGNQDISEEFRLVLRGNHYLTSTVAPAHHAAPLPLTAEGRNSDLSELPMGPETSEPPLFTGVTNQRQTRRRAPAASWSYVDGRGRPIEAPVEGFIPLTQRVAEDFEETRRARAQDRSSLNLVEEMHAQARRMTNPGRVMGVTGPVDGSFRSAYEAEVAANIRRGMAESALTGSPHFVEETERFSRDTVRRMVEAGIRSTLDVDLPEIDE